ncbi:MAG TPA: TonB-dependent receptor, partial [Chitinophagales bacterium]
MPQQSPKMNIGHVYGKVIDAKTKQPMGYTAVAILTADKDSLVDGQLTEDNGDFSLENLPFGKLHLRITSVGYTTLSQDITISMNSADQDVGDLAMKLSETELKEAVVTADRSAVELKTDRKVVNVDQYANAKGGTAMDVIKNVPGISVDANGNVAIRNNTPYIYIDGKPSQLTLDQIPADQIDRVEIITNPSAKFDATATGGILNIILKRNTKPGYNGTVNFSVGTNNQYNGMALLNLRMKKFGFNVSYNINSAINNPHTFTDRKNFDNTGAVSSSAYQDMMTKNGRTFQNARVGFDWYINNRNTLSISENGTF